MFSGLVQHLCPLGSVNGRRISVLAPHKRYQMGESISINGVCLTVSGIKKGSKATELWFDLSPETLQKTNLKGLKNGDQVNFERSLTLNDLLGGHIVQGHVDGVGVV